MPAAVLYWRRAPDDARSTSRHGRRKTGQPPTLPSKPGRNLPQRARFSPHDRFDKAPANPVRLYQPRQRTRRFQQPASPHATVEFVAKWARQYVNEKQVYQQHFLDLCALVGHPLPAALRPGEQVFTFEAGAAAGGGNGWAMSGTKGTFHRIQRAGKSPAVAYERFCSTVNRWKIRRSPATTQEPAHPHQLHE